MKIVCLGDSLTHGYKVRKSETWPALIGQSLNIEVLNRGINGDTTGGMLGRFYFDVISERPSHVIIMGGANDLIYGVPITVVEANLATMVQQAFHHGIIPLVGIPIPIEVAKAKKHWPCVNDFELTNEKLKELRQWILNFSQNFCVSVFDFYKIFFDSNHIETDHFIDGLHPTPVGNKLISKIILQNLSNL